MSVILRISGSEFDIDKFNIGWDLKYSAIHRKGDKGRNKRILSTSQMIFHISDAGDSDLNGQINDTIEFLKSNSVHLALLSSDDTIEHITLSFSFNSRIDGVNVAVQMDFLPPKFIQLAASFNMGVELMQWPFEPKE